MRDGDTGTYLGELVIKCGMKEEAGDWGKLYLKGLCLVGLHITQLDKDICLMPYLYMGGGKLVEENSGHWCFVSWAEYRPIRGDASPVCKIPMMPVLQET